MEVLYRNLLNLQWQHVVMWGIGALLIYLAIKKDMEPSLLLPIGFGAIIANLPMSGAVDQLIGEALERGPLSSFIMPELQTSCFRSYCLSA